MLGNYSAGRRHDKSFGDGGSASQTMLQYQSCSISVECHTCWRLCQVFPSLQSHRGMSGVGPAPGPPSGLVPASPSAALVLASPSAALVLASPSAALVSPACWGICSVLQGRTVLAAAACISATVLHTLKAGPLTQQLTSHKYQVLLGYYVAL